MVTIIGPKDPRNPQAINTTSRSSTWSKGLSPFFLGPVKLYGNYVAQKVENAWQFTKLYREHADINNEPTDKYWEWAKAGWNSQWAERYPMGRGKKPLCSLWDGKRYTYIEARKNIYIPLYSQAVRETEAYKTLSQIYNSEKKIILWDFDGYNHRELGMSYEDVVNCETRKCGHAFVLAMMLEGIL
jgi:hypothetical protein